jgi:hypothetical protein
METPAKLCREAFILLLIGEDLSDVLQIHDFRWKMDQFAQDWFKTNMGDEGATKHVHDSHSGHISNCLFHWRNLHTRSQQG